MSYSENTKKYKYVINYLANWQENSSSSEPFGTGLKIGQVYFRVNTSSKGAF